ncbi:conjugal transfer/type IV secretion protein DotA/TraY [Oxalobacteraceae bacterium GrIS 1.11]
MKMLTNPFPLFASLALSIAALPALADEGTTLGVIGDAARRSGDKSRQALVSIFGDVVNNPLAAGGSGGDTILAVLFQTTNGALLVVGAMFACYIWFRNLTKIAHDGTVFERANHTLWGPVRMVWGLASLVPTANGWALSQLLMLWAASLLGVGIANLGTDGAIAAFRDGKGMIVQPAMPSTVTLARTVFEENLCMHSMNAGLALAGSNGGFDFPNEYIQQFGTANGFILQRPNGAKVCGGASIDPSLLSPVPLSTSWFAGNIDTSTVYQAHLAALRNMQNVLMKEALDFVNAVLKQSNGETVTIPDASLAIEHAAGAYESYVNKEAGTRAGDIGALAANLSDKIKDGGWWTLGAWYQTFAHANSKLSNAVAGKAQTFGEGYAGDQGIASVRDAIMRAYKTQQATSSDSFAMGQSVSTASTDTNKLLGSMFASSGQRIVAYMTSVDFGASGVGTINPLIKMKNLGDYTLATAETATAAFVGVKIAADVARGNNIVAKGANLFTGIGDVLKGAVDAVSPFFLMLIIPMYILGAGLSIYLPLVPFIIWFGAIINWLVVVLEAIVAAPLWAMTHLDGEGEGMGARSAHGYIFLLNVIVRPFLMVIGFFGGGACLVVGGTFLNQIYGIAVANVQFDSVTGLISMLSFLYVYFSVSLTLIHSCFNLILIVPDQVINWVGGTASSSLGRDTSEAVRNYVNVLSQKMEHMRKGPSSPADKSPRPGNGIKK